jgi:hypothetical protein
MRRRQARQLEESQACVLRSLFRLSPVDVYD